MKRTMLIVACVLSIALSSRGQATGLSGTIRVWPSISHSKSNGQAVVAESIGMIVERPVTFGTNANQMTKWSSKALTLTNSEAVTLSLLGGVSNNFGDALTFGRVNWLAVVAPTGNAAAVTVGGAAENPFVGWIGGTTPTASAMPGGAIVAFAPDETGYAVATNSCNLKISNAGTNAASIVIYIGGN